MSRIVELIGKAEHVTVTTLSDNVVNVLAGESEFVKRLHGAFIAEHGLSLLIEVQSELGHRTFLVDTGQGLTLKHNMEQMKIDVNRIEYLVISHGHYDHTGGIVEFLKAIDHEMPVVAHPDAFKPSIWIKREGTIRRPFLPVPVTDMESAGGRLILTKGVFPLFTGTLTTGEVERRAPFECLEGVFYVDDEGIIESPIKDDQAVIIDLKNRGLVIVSGCGHAGIANTICQARKLTGVNQVCCVVGGFHLVGSSEDRIGKTIQYLKKLKAEVISPMHCSGFDFTLKAATELSDCFVLNGVGTQIIL